jgi:hypothetical protein
VVVSIAVLARAESRLAILRRPSEP